MIRRQQALAALQGVLEHNPFSELAVIVLLVILITCVMRLLRQPLIIGYIIAGIIISPNVANLLQNTESVHVFSEIGVALLLFMVGLGLNPKIIKDVGKASLVVGVGQVVFTTAIGFFLTRALGFDMITSLYVAIALAFSSTIIIVKLLTDKGVLDELYGKISIGLLIVQDIIAMLLLMVLSSLPAGGESVQRLPFIAILIAKIILIAIIVRSLIKYIMPRILPHIAKSQEFLLLFALGRCFIAAAAMKFAGFSLEIGALLAGLTMAALPYRFEIMSKMRPLRDFFIVLFFVYLGSQLQFSDISAYIIPIVILSLFVLLGNPFIVMTLMGIMGYKRKNGLMVGFTVAQISEFSFILMALGLAIGHITDIEIVSMVTIIGLVTIAGSSYYFAYSEKLFTRLKPFLTIFEKKKATAEKKFNKQDIHYDVIVFGNHRTGSSIVQMLQQNKKSFVIVDYDPQVISKLEKQNIPCLYGDAADIELLEELHLSTAKMLVSTVHDYDTNALLLRKAKMHNPQAIAILSATTVQEAEYLYQQGADYVLVPHMIGGQHTAMLIENYEYDMEKYLQNKQIHRSVLQASL